MNMMDVLYPILAIGGLGIIFGIGLGIAAKKFAVPVDERVEDVKNYLPGANCGGCGFAGCDAFAKAVVAGEVKVNGCPVCNDEQVGHIARVMGQIAEVGVKYKAFVKCRGTIANAPQKFEYTGVKSCEQAQLVGGGPKKCSYGCLGFGSCMDVCAFGAIEVKDGLAIVNKEKCTGCSSCLKVCPRNLIDLIPENATYIVNCKSQDKGKDVKQNCQVGCIGCGICVKKCEFGAITLKNQYAVIDPEKCTGCGACAEKCPTKAIVK